MQRDQRHHPCLLAAALQLLQQHAGFLRLEIAHAAIVWPGHLDADEGIWAIVQSPYPHASHHTADQSYSQRDALCGKPLGVHICHQEINPIRSDFREPERGEDLQVTTDEGQIAACVLVLGQHPVMVVAFPGRSECGVALDALLLPGRLLLSTDDLDTDLMGFSGCHPATGPANGLSLALPFAVAIIYTEGDIRTSVMASQARFVGVYARVACALSFCHLVTIWCPNGMLGDHFVPLTRNPMHLRTIVTLRNLNSSNVELHQTTQVNNSLFRLITGRSQVRVLVGPPIFERQVPFAETCLFIFHRYPGVLPGLPVFPIPMPASPRTADSRAARHP